MDTLPLVSAEKEGILQHAWEHWLSASDSWFPLLGVEMTKHSGSSLATHLHDGSVEDLAMVTGACQVSLGRSQHMTLRMDSHIVVTHSFQYCSYALIGDVSPLIRTALSMSPPSATWLPWPL